MKNNPRTRARRWVMRAHLPVQVFLALFLALTVAAQDRPADPFLQGQGKLNVMTYNMYVGTEYTGINTAASLDAFYQAINAANNDVAASDPTARVQAIARQIAAVKPDLVSLQEVATWSLGTYTGTWTGATSCDNLRIEFDYRQLLLDELVAQGAHYTPVATNTHFTVDGAISGTECVRNTWSIVVLARADLKPEDFSYSNVQTGTFVHVLKIPIAILGSSYRLSWPRGWISVDVNYRGKPVRFIAAHLDNIAYYNVPQGLELLAGPARTSLPTLVAGDMNTPDPAGSTTYNNFLSAGFIDGWYTARNVLDSGYSGYTKPYPFPMDERGDLVLVRGRFLVKAAAVLCGGSNHCGVVAGLQLPDTD